MSTRTANYLEAVDHLPAGATLVIHDVTWDDYEKLLEDVGNRPGLRISYDCGRLEIMSPTREHEEYGRFIERLVQVLAEEFDLTVQSYGSATWKRQKLAKGAEPDCCYYVKNAGRVTGKREFDLESNPPPDIVVEIDITNESLSKFPIYAALSVPEIWRYDEAKVQFYELFRNRYREIPESRFFPHLTPKMLADSLTQSKSEGQTAALRSFRKGLRKR
jgi:Uma2 family endonuclease